MRGQVLGVDTRTGEGQVAGEDGRRYVFGPADWASRGEPAVGALVDFETDRNRALSLFPVPGSASVMATRVAGPPPEAAGDKVLAALLAFFLGIFGAHRFYLGREGSGVMMLLLTFTAVGVIISWPWSMVDFFRYLTMSNGEFAARYPRR